MRLVGICFSEDKYPAEISLFSLGKIIFAADFKNALKMVSQGIYSIVLLVFSNVFMTFAWYGHLKMREEFSWFAALPLIGVIAFSWAIAFFEYCLQVPANRLGFKDSGGPFDIMQLKVIQEVITLAVFTIFL